MLWLSLFTRMSLEVFKESSLRRFQIRRLKEITCSEIRQAECSQHLVRQWRAMVLRLQLKPFETPCPIPKMLWLIGVLEKLNANRQFPGALVQHQVQGPYEPKRGADELCGRHRSTWDQRKK